MTVQNIGARRAIAQAPHREIGMRKCVVRDRMTVRDFALDQIRQGLGVAADEEKRRFHAFLGECLEHYGGRAGSRPIIKG